MRFAVTALLAAACLTGAALPATGQPNRAPVIAVAVTSAPVFVLPDAGRTPLRTLPPGTRLRVLDDRGEWLRVQFADPQWGPRIGFIQRKLVEISEPPEPPRDAAPMLPKAGPEAPQKPGRRPARAWIDVNGGVALAGDGDYASSGTRVISGQTATFRVDYHLPAGPAFEIGGGVMATPLVGIGATLDIATHEDVAALSIDIPHPVLAGVHAAADGRTSRELRRRENSLHIHGTVVFEPSRELRTRLFAGSTYFRVEQDVVSEIRYSPQLLSSDPPTDVDITSASIVRIPSDEAGGWGVHVGADASWFFRDGLGIGGVLRYSRGTVEIQDPLVNGTAELAVGGLQAAAGLRVRF
ncbi:MAG TPA: SH3 domain-containing protein [Vicinamibacterales bacterium]|nr:SH3 domain-containing protein [Vicinamibacterales bacterium]